MTLRRRIAAWARLVPGLMPLKHRLFNPLNPYLTVPVNKPTDRGKPPVVNPQAIREHYQTSTLVRKADTFILYRIIGNDIEPRHRKGQSRENLAFILDHEPELEGCEKAFVVNRIVDSNEEAAIIKLLEAAGCPFIHIPFDADAYRACGLDMAGVPSTYLPSAPDFSRLRPQQQDRVLARIYRYKNNYVMNNNGARNQALREGRTKAKWVLPWDGNCFLTAAAWRSLRDGVVQSPEMPLHVVPMARVLNNQALLDRTFCPPAEEEPQLVFRQDLDEDFDESYFYGRRPKVEMFWRMAVTGEWDHWDLEPWDLPCPEYSRHAGCYRYSGWVARLYSGRGELEQSRGDAAFRQRGQARNRGIIDLIDRLDAQLHADDGHDRDGQKAAGDGWGQ